MEPSKDLATREGILGFLEHMKSSVVGLFERAGDVRPHAIIFADRTPHDGAPIRDRDGKPVTIPSFVFVDQFEGARSKDFFAAEVTRMLERAHACGVMMISEVWTAAPPPGGGRDDLPRSFAEPFPGRREGIMLHLEHVALADPVWLFAEIKRTSAGKGYLPKPFEDMTHGQQHVLLGRFSHLLKRAGS